MQPVPELLVFDLVLLVKLEDALRDQEGRGSSTENFMVEVR